jgi:hypothetical protein
VFKQATGASDSNAVDAAAGPLRDSHHGKRKDRQGPVFRCRLKGDCRAGIAALLDIVLISKFAGFGLWA